MRPRRAVIVAGTIALLSPMLTLHSRVYAQTEGPMATGKRDAASGTEAAAAANLKGDIRWAKPAPKSGPSTDVVVIAPPQP